MDSGTGSFRATGAAEGAMVTEYSAEEAERARVTIVKEAKRRRAELPEWRQRERDRMLEKIEERHDYIMRGGERSGNKR